MGLFTEALAVPKYIMYAGGPRDGESEYITGETKFIHVTGRRGGKLVSGEYRPNPEHPDSAWVWYENA